MIDRETGAPGYLEPLVSNRALPLNNPIVRKVAQGIRFGHPSERSVRLMIDEYKDGENLIVLRVDEKKGNSVLEQTFTVRPDITYRLNGTPFHFQLKRRSRQRMVHQFAFLTEAPKKIIVGRAESKGFRGKPKR